MLTTQRRQRPVDTPVRCFHADDPALRPDCDLTATVRYGTVPLCTSCQARRSTLGKGQAAVPLPAGLPVDVLGWVAAAADHAAAADRALTAAVTRARQTGASWTLIGAQLGVTRQAAQQRFTRASARGPTNPPRRAS